LRGQRGRRLTGRGGASNGDGERWGQLRPEVAGLVGEQHGVTMVLVEDGARRSRPEAGCRRGGALAAKKTAPAVRCSAQSCKADGDAARPRSWRRPEAVRHEADGSADRRQGGCRWRSGQRKGVRHGMALEDGMRWNSEEEAWSTGGNHGKAAAHNMNSTWKQVEESEREDKEEAAHNGKTWSEAKHRKWAAPWHACR
jgi:hypothetical protein